MKSYLLITILFFLFSCDSKTTKTNITTNGVSLSLAQERKEKIKDINYFIKFNFSEAKNLEKLCSGEVDIKFTLSQNDFVVLDFKAPKEYIKNVELNGAITDYKVENEHITVKCEEGINHINIKFTTPDRALNRRAEFLYTLLVPDRARTLFPCFDQPNLKAHFNLEVEVPQDWVAIGNGKIKSSKNNANSKTISFERTEPLSTYLFSVVAGELTSITKSDQGREISLYHRETDDEKLKQTDEIFRQVFASLKWLEQYTTIAYPFAKYDLIILPGFQYGGMEHTGATLYSDRVMFLSANPTINEELSRANLIAHETAHMWFGDYVTMNWFNDVWTKEVFANYFASEIVSPQFPEVNHRLNFMQYYAPSAYVEDRTAGANPIQQTLDNLEDAGLVYGNIIYQKSPMVMNILVSIIGKDNFRKGIIEYLTQYGYSNATWDDLIAILDKYSEKDLLSWSNVWVKESGMPTVEFSEDSIKQSDKQGRDLLWVQPITISCNARKEIVNTDSKSIKNPFNSLYIIPNSDGTSYGYFKLQPITLEYLQQNITNIKDDVERGSVLITLNENFMNGNLDAESYINTLSNLIAAEQNNLLLSDAIHYLKYAIHISGKKSPKAENALWEKSANSIVAFRAYSNIVSDDKGIDRLYKRWLANSNLSESDAINLSYQLAILLRDKNKEIIETQLARISNPDRKKEYSFIAPATSNEVTVRDSVFNSLLDAKNRVIEPWVQTSLSLLNHRLRQSESLKYIRQGLDEVKEIQKTGDIFFPSSWCNALLSGHTSKEAKDIVETFIKENPNYSEKLLLKIKQKSHHLYIQLK